MTWQDRVKPAAYTSPSGQRLTFIYEDVSLSFDKNGASYTFPDAVGTYMQDLGRSGRRYPLSLIFSGANCDLEADLMLAMLSESGTGKLEHPMYGAVNVVPFGEISRKDALVTAANQAILEVTFWETTGLVYPTSQGDAASEVSRAVAAYNEAIAQQFADSISLKTPSARAGLYGDFSAAFNQATAQLKGLTNSSNDIKRQFNAIERSIINGLDDLIGDPLILALQTSLFVQSPSRALTSGIEARLSAYRSIVATIGGTVDGRGFGVRNSNRFKARDLFVSGAVSGQVLSVLNNQFTTKSGALLAAETLLNQLDIVTVWREQNFAALGGADTGESYTELQGAVAVAAGYLVEISFTLRQERVLTLDRARTVVDLVAELYGSVDDQLDFFITSNALSGTEILELPRGRRIAYYI